MALRTGRIYKRTRLKLLTGYKYSLAITILLVTLTIVFFRPYDEECKGVYYQYEHTIKTNSCYIPSQPFLNPEIVNLFTKSNRKISKCRAKKYPILLSNATHVWIDRHKLAGLASVTCCYKSFFPFSYTDKGSSRKERRTSYSHCVYFSDAIAVDASHEYAKVTCHNDANEIEIHEEFFIFPIVKASTVLPVIGDAKPPRYNVLVLGLGSVSRLNFHRTMPKTAAFFRENGAKEMRGYSRVGEGAFSNLMPMLASKPAVSVAAICRPEARLSLDNYPFIWDSFKRAGYYTAFVEDSTKAEIFRECLNHFAKPPTDYFTHPFINEAEAKVGNNQGYSSFGCLGDRYSYTVVLDYLQSLTRALATSRLFAFFWETTMSSDHFIDPRAMDDIYEAFLNKLFSSGYLDKTITIFVSDQGIAWGPLRFTRQGHLEERLPMLSILIPPSFRKYYKLAYENLKVNRKQLTTPYDLHATLVDLADSARIRDEEILYRRKLHADQRGISLFLPIPSNRTCQSAGIPGSDCACGSSLQIPESKEHVAMANALLDSLNEVPLNNKQCAIFQLKKIILCRPVKSISKKYRIIVLLMPGDAIFEGNISLHINGWRVSDNIQRLTSYLHASECMNIDELKSYCQCKDTPNTTLYPQFM